MVEFALTVRVALEAIVIGLAATQLQFCCVVKLASIWFSASTNNFSLPGPTVPPLEGKFVKADPSPEKAVAVNVPDEELKVKLEPLLGAKLPVAPVVNKGKQVVSDDSSAIVIVVAIAAVPVVS